MLSASALQSRSTRRRARPSVREPTRRPGGAEQPSALRPKYIDGRPSGDSRLPIHSAARERRDGVPQSAAAAQPGLRPGKMPHSRQAMPLRLQLGKISSSEKSPFTLRCFDLHFLRSPDRLRTRIRFHEPRSGVEVAEAVSDSKKIDTLEPAQQYLRGRFSSPHEPWMQSMKMRLDKADRLQFR